MSDDLKSDELVLRTIVRLEKELSGEFAREDLDSDDFLRKKKYRGMDVPEFGMSLMRDCKFKDANAVYKRVGIKKKATGIAQAKWAQLESKAITHTLGGDEQEHISLHCENCDFVLEEDTKGKRIRSCKPKGSSSYDDCPLFSPDPLDLLKEFTVIDKPKLRT